MVEGLELTMGLEGDVLAEAPGALELGAGPEGIGMLELCEGCGPPADPLGLGEPAGPDG